MSERILSVLVEDKPGVLARVSSTISRRGFNINSLASLSNATSVDVGQDFAIFELTGSSKELDKFEALMKPFGIIEMVRGGRIAIQSNL